MNNRDEILTTLATDSARLRRLGVKRLGLFGSPARGEAVAASDFDFVVEFGRRSFDAYMELKLHLEDLFCRRVDLVLSDSIKPRLRPVIVKETIYVQRF